MKFEDCYPVEIVEWAQALTEPEQCTPQEEEIAGLLGDESVIAIGQALIQRLNNAATREGAAQMTTFFRGLIQDAAYMRHHRG